GLVIAGAALELRTLRHRQDLRLDADPAEIEADEAAAREPCRIVEALGAATDTERGQRRAELEADGLAGRRRRGKCEQRCAGKDRTRNSSHDHSVLVSARTGMARARGTA